MSWRFWALCLYLEQKGGRALEQKKIGAFLKKLRNEKGITQEQLAEKFCVSNRTISRWETGSNMPDLSVIVELADYYGVEIREILEGERKSEQMKNEEKQTLLKAAKYSNSEKMKLKKRMLDMTIGAFVIFVFYGLLDATGGLGFISPDACENMETFTLGLIAGYMCLEMLYLQGALEKLQQFKLRLFRRNSEEK